MPSVPSTALPHCIGLMADLIGPSRLELMIGAAVEHLETRGYDTLVVSSGKSADDELRAWDALARSHCDAIIAHSDALSNDKLSRLISTRKNVVLANLNEKFAGQLAATHLIDMGHRNLTLVAGPSERYSARQLTEGFSQIINQSRSAKFTYQVLNAPISKLGGAQAMLDILDNDVRPSAVFFQCDSMSFGALDTCQEKAIRVPYDVSILGCGDLVEARHASIALSTIRPPLAAIGQLSAAQVMRSLDSNTKIATSDINPEAQRPVLVARKSIQDKRKNYPLQDEATSKISKRERECLQWASKGKTSWEISQILGVTESTVIYHMRNATRKLNASNRLHAVAKALKASIIDF